jgi:hypothetical protein
VPDDRHPHCHWTITINPANEPVGQVPLTEAVVRLPLARISNERSAVAGPEEARMVDYSGNFEPAFRLGDLATPTLAAVTREFQMQTHLLICSGELALREKFGDDAGLAMTESTWVGAAWIAAERLGETIEPAPDVASHLARALALTPALPPGFDRDVRCDGRRVLVTITPQFAGLDDEQHPGCAGLLARGKTRGIEATVHAIDPRASVSLVDATEGLTVEIEVEALAHPVSEPPEVPLMRIGMVSSWEFAIADGSVASGDD